ncbi:imidazole glycerol phosphate synthase subunit HisH [Bremerella cremea]|uniref:Imidazole glycerol phosphate synthase subunit HisH n=1 Tax=Blastopirellula marina TaxID=124 RepID=A0A2S8FRA8_9BACT|nr:MULTISPECIES: imidazole glycerol phosphate synthase subunit HisH [Pirellulaceae]PQO34687.1 imidazole glycerol phosphate synthase subunit HisH [Blastopirellula marina]RCS47185.1 imidazole glycerol phosphate synthase subunit HisH [Bremerella cremea]
MITIVDYQMGNLRSVQKAFERTGHEAHITSDPKEIAAASKVVLPGVGACGDAVDELRRRNLVSPIKDQIESGTPFLGICLGLQMLFDVSYEGGEHEGLGILPGEVVKFNLPHGYKVPHMGWNQAKFLHKPPIFTGIDEGTHFYFVHSYYVIPRDKDVVAIEADYGGPFCAAIWKNNLYATQFHPEKSQDAGLAVLKNFAELA